MDGDFMKPLVDAVGCMFWLLIFCFVLVLIMAGIIIYMIAS